MKGFFCTRTGFPAVDFRYSSLTLALTQAG